MDDGNLLLLRTLNSAFELETADQLSAEKVNGLAQSLGLELQEAFRTLEDLARQELLELHWGGGVAITSKGRSTLHPGDSLTSQVSLGNGAVYIGSGAQVGSGAAVGKDAMGPGAVRLQGNLETKLIDIIADMTAAQGRLASMHNMLAPDAQKVSEEMREATDAVRQELRKPSPSKPVLEQRLERAKGVLDRLGALAVSAAALNPALHFLARSFDWVKMHLAGIAS